MGAKFQVEFVGARQWAGQSATVRGAERARQEPESPRRRDRDEGSRGRRGTKSLRLACWGKAGSSGGAKMGWWCRVASAASRGGEVSLVAHGWASTAFI